MVMYSALFAVLLFSTDSRATNLILNKNKSYLMQI